jgi:hypothetical protein
MEIPFGTKVDRPQSIENAVRILKATRPRKRVNSVVTLPRFHVRKRSTNHVRDVWHRRCS